MSPNNFGNPRRDQEAGRGRSGPGQRRGKPLSPRAREVDPARRAAYDVLRLVEDGAYANLALPPLLRSRYITGRDAAFATELTYGTLRLRGRYDPVIAHVAERPLEQIDRNVLQLLRLGVHQLAALRIPDHAAVSATVALATVAVTTGPAQFVNAVLRSVADGPFDALLEEVIPADPVEAMAIRHSHPTWIIRTLRQALSINARPTGDLEAVLAANNLQPKITLAAWPGLVERQDLIAQAADGASLGRWTPTAVILDRGAPGDIDAIKRGQAAVQDEGSQLVALALAGAPLDGADATWLDLCAGPGGKAALLGAVAAQRGARLVANEPQASRAELVRGLTARLGEVVEVRQSDGRDLGQREPATYDRVLVDVPCTGLGSLRRRPEARWRHAPGDLAQLGPLQRDLLASGLRALRPGGVLAYATCSPHLAETRLVVTDALARAERDGIGAAVIDAASLPLLAATGAVGKDGMVQLWTDLHGTDAMFLALLRRTS